MRDIAIDGVRYRLKALPAVWRRRWAMIHSIGFFFREKRCELSS